MGDTPQDKPQPPEHRGKITLNELFEFAPEKLWDKNWKRQERKFMLLRAIVDLDNEGLIQKSFVSHDQAKKYWEHKFGINAIGFSYTNTDRKNVRDLCEAIKKAGVDISNTIKNQNRRI